MPELLDLFRMDNRNLLSLETTVTAFRQIFSEAVFIAVKNQKDLNWAQLVDTREGWTFRTSHIMNKLHSIWNGCGILPKLHDMQLHWAVREFKRSHKR